MNGWHSLKDWALFYLHQTRQNHLQRSLEDQVDGMDPFVLCHNDALGLRWDLTFQKLCKEAIHNLPVGSGGSRLLGGHWPVYEQLEKDFASFKGSESALFFATGYGANLGVLTALSHPEWTLCSHRRNHASLIDGGKQGFDRTQRLIYEDWKDLDRQLQTSRSPCHILATESLFSMDGDVMPLEELWEVAHRHRGVLVIDEAHALGVYGEKGQGLISKTSLPKEHILSINPCGKGFGVQGAFVCGPQWLKDLMIHRSRSFLFSTAPSPWIAAALQVALAYVPTLTERRLQLENIHSFVRRSLHTMGIHTYGSSSHIVPIRCGDEGKAVALSAYLRSHGIYIRPIRYPTVPKGDARIRLSLHAGLSPDQLERLLSLIQKGMQTL